MDFEVSINEQAESYPVVSVRGEVDIHTAPKVQDAIERIGHNGVEVVAVDMSGIEFMDSTALSTFMRLRDSLGERDTALRLISPSPAVRRIFDVTGFGDYFEIYDSREDAASGRD